jgi:uncharacterized protein YcnI
MTKHRARRGLLACGLAVAGLLIAAPSAFAHAIVSPPVAKSGVDQVFTLTVPNEKKGVTVTKVEMTVPSGAGIDSFEDAPGWTRTEQTEGEEVSSVTWEGGATPEGDMAVFRWQGALSAAQTYTFHVTETYSDGSVVEWTGDPSAETPAPQVEGVSSLGGGSSSTLAIAALVVAGIALVLGVAALVGGRRSLT